MVYNPNAFNPNSGSAGYDPNMYGQSPGNDPFAFAEAANKSQQPSRFREALKTVATSAEMKVVQERAKHIVETVGREAVKGAVEGAKEGSGLVRVDKHGQERLSKRGVAKAILRPKATIRKTAWGAAKGAQKAAVTEARSQVESARGEAKEAAVNWTANKVKSVAGEVSWNSIKQNVVANRMSEPSTSKRSLRNLFKIGSRRETYAPSPAPAAEGLAYVSPFDRPPVPDQAPSFAASYNAAPQPANNVIDMASRRPFGGPAEVSASQHAPFGQMSEVQPLHPFGNPDGPPQQPLPAYGQGAGAGEAYHRAA